MYEIGEVLVYLGGDTFLDNHLEINKTYIIESFGNLSHSASCQKFDYVTFEGNNHKSYTHVLRTNFKSISKDREIKLKTLLND